MKVKISLNNLLSVLIILIISEPDYFKQIENNSINTLFVITQIIIGIIFTTYFFVIYRGNLLQNKAGFLLILIDVWILLVTFLRHGNLYAAFAKLLTITVMVEVYEWYGDKKDRLINNLMLCFELLLYYQFVEMITTTNDGAYWFLGQQNELFRYMLPGFCVSLLYGYMHNNYYRTIPLCIAINVIAVYSKSSTTLLCILVLDLFTFGYRLTKLLNAKVLVSSVVILFVFIVLIQSSSLNGIITSLFGKSTTYHGRAPIWQYVIRQILNHPIIGSGRGNFFVSQWYEATHSHDYYLELAFRGGIIAVILFVAVVKNVILKLFQYKGTQIYVFLLGAVIVYFVSSIVEVHEYHLTFLVFLLAYDIDKIIESMKGKENNYVISNG